MLPVRSRAEQEYTYTFANQVVGEPLPAAKKRPFEDGKSTAVDLSYKVCDFGYCVGGLGMLIGILEGIAEGCVTGFDTVNESAVDELLAWCGSSCQQSQQAFQGRQGGICGCQICGEGCQSQAISLALCMTKRKCAHIC